MKYLALILILATTSAYAGGEEIVWTSDTTYIKGGVEYISQEALFEKVLNKYVIENEEDVPNPYDIYMGKEYDSNPCNTNADLWLFKPATDWC